MSVFNDYASFMILRPDPERISDETRLNIAAYANEELTGIPYTVFAGIFRKKYQQPLKGTQCAHIVWYAYRRFGMTSSLLSKASICWYPRSPLMDNPL